MIRPQGWSWVRRLVPTQEGTAESWLLSLLHHVRVPGEGSCPPAGTQALSRCWICWSLDLGLPSLQKYTFEMREVNVYCFSHPVYDIFVTSAQSEIPDFDGNSEMSRDLKAFQLNFTKIQETNCKRHYFSFFHYFNHLKSFPWAIKKKNVGSLFKTLIL